MSKLHNFRVVHRYGVTTTPRVIQCLNTGRLSECVGDKPSIVKHGGLTFHVMKRHVGSKNHVVIQPYTGRFPRVAFWCKRALEVFA